VAYMDRIAREEAAVSGTYSTQLQVQSGPECEHTSCCPDRAGRLSSRLNVRDRSS
jgi:hypothetical protein